MTAFDIGSDLQEPHEDREPDDLMHWADEAWADYTLVVDEEASAADELRGRTDEIELGPVVG